MCGSSRPVLISMNNAIVKRRRLDALRRRVPHTSVSALSKIINDFHKNGLPDQCSRTDFRLGRNYIANAPTPYGQVLSDITLLASAASGDANPPTVCIAKPHAMLWFAVHECEAFSNFFVTCLRQHPSTEDSPWRIALYSDEVTPGNAMAHHITRKIHTLYWSFLEFGLNALSHEDFWFTVTTKRSTDCKLVAGNLAQLFGVVIKSMFPIEGVTFAKGGIMLKLPNGELIRFFAIVFIVVQDGSAHNQT